MKQRPFAAKGQNSTLPVVGCEIKKLNGKYLSTLRILPASIGFTFALLVHNGIVVFVMMSPLKVRSEWYRVQFICRARFIEVQRIIVCSSFKQDASTSTK